MNAKQRRKNRRTPTTHDNTEEVSALLLGMDNQYGLLSATRDRANALDLEVIDLKEKLHNRNTVIILMGCLLVASVVLRLT